MGLGHEAGVLSGVCLHEAHLKTGQRPGWRRGQAWGWEPALLTSSD